MCVETGHVDVGGVPNLQPPITGLLAPSAMTDANDLPTSRGKLPCDVAAEKARRAGHEDAMICYSVQACSTVRQGPGTDADVQDRFEHVSSATVQLIGPPRPGSRVAVLRVLRLLKWPTAATRDPPITENSGPP